MLFYFPLREWPRFENCFRKVFVWCAFFPIFFIFQFRALLTKEMEKEHAHINGGGCNKLATCSLTSSFYLKNVQFFFSKLALHARTTHVLSFLHVQRPGPQFPPPPNHARAAQAHLVPLFCRSLTPSSILFPLMYRMATRLSLRPRPTVAPPPWSSSWRQARTRTRKTM